MSRWVSLLNFSWTYLDHVGLILMGILTIKIEKTLVHFQLWKFSPEWKQLINCQTVHLQKIYSLHHCHLPRGHFCSVEFFYLVRRVVINMSYNYSSCIFWQLISQNRSWIVIPEWKIPLLNFNMSLRLSSGSNENSHLWIIEFHPHGFAEQLTPKRSSPLSVILTLLDPPVNMTTNMSHISVSDMAFVLG